VTRAGLRRYAFPGPGMLWAFSAVCLVPGVLVLVLAWRPVYVAFLALGWAALMARVGWTDTRRWLASDTRELRGELLALTRLMAREAACWLDREDDVVLRPCKLGRLRAWAVIRADPADLDAAGVFMVPESFPGVQFRQVHTAELELRQPVWKRVWGDYRAEAQGLYGASPGEVRYLLAQLRRAVPLEHLPGED
jgi:hypothetical protein